MKSSISVEFHAGKQLIRNAQVYPTLWQCLLELIQNSLDSGAKLITVVLNYDKRTLVVQDNGSGVSQNQFAEKLGNVAGTLKGDGKLGQFGLGFFAPLGKCDSFSFISMPRYNPEEGFTEYSFVTKDIEASKTVRIPHAHRRDLAHESAASTGVWWRTSIEATKLSKDKAMSRIDLEEFIQDVAVRYGSVIRANDVAIDIAIIKDGVRSERSVAVPEFTGNPLSLYSNENQREAGLVEMELFLALRTAGGRKGKVIISKTGNPFSFDFEKFIRFAGDTLSSRVIEAFRSGVFEGRIKCKRLTLHQSRESFLCDDAMVGLGLVLDEWFESVGQKHIEEIREDDRDARLQDMGRLAMSFARQLLCLESYKDVAGRIKIGSVGNGHKPPKTGSLEDEKSLLGVTLSGNDAAGAGGASRKRTPHPKTDHPEHVPGIVAGPNGRRRTEVKDDSTGLRFSCIEFDNPIVPFEFDVKTGTIFINTRHPDFGACETEGDQQIIEYHILVAQTALDLARFEGSASFADIERYAMGSLRTPVFTLLNGKPVVSKAVKAAKEMNKKR